MDRGELQQLLIKHEGWRNKRYLDTRGNPSVGVGFNLRAAGARPLVTSLGINYDLLISGRVALTDAQVQQLFDKSTNFAIASANLLVPNFPYLPNPVQIAVVDMIYNLGYTGFGEFTELRAALARLDFKDAATQMEASDWYLELTGRATDDINLVLSAVAPPTTA